MEQVKGIFAATLSLLDKNLALDIKNTIKHAENIIDNGCHGETGGQTGHTSHRTDLELIAKGAGLKSTLTLSESQQIEQATQFLSGSEPPRFLLCRVIDSPPASFKRNIDPVACRLRFKDHVALTE